MDAITRSTTFLLAALTLAGCGGSSGGGAATPPPSPNPPPTPLPVVDLSSSLAMEAASTVIRALEQASAAAEVAAFASDEQSSEQAAAARCVTPNAETVYIDDGDNVFSDGDRLTVLYATCHGSTGEAGITLEEVEPDANRLAAHVEFTSTDGAGNTTEGSFELVSTYRLDTVGREQTLSDLELIYTRDDAVETISAARLVRRYDDAQQYGYELSGDVSSSAIEGDFSFADEAPMTGVFGAPPTAGALVITSGSTRARFSPSSVAERRATMAELTLDDGSGAYGPPLQVPWSPLTTGLLFDWQPVVAPFVSELSIAPADATALDALTAVYTIDYAGDDALVETLSWARNGAPIAGADTDGLPAGQHARDDLIEVRVRVENEAGVGDERTASITIANAAPGNASVTLSPPSPNAGEAIEISWTATDPDDDSLTATYEWYRNGTLVEGQTERVLPGTVSSAGDVIRGVAVISDGALTTTAEGTVAIGGGTGGGGDDNGSDGGGDDDDGDNGAGGGAPGIVSLPFVPSVAVPGVTTEFDVGFEDPDGDPLGARRFELVYGPSDMSIDPATGRISYTDRSPMLGRSRQVNFAVTLSEPGANVATGSIELYDADRPLPLMWSGIYPPQPGGLQVGDFDADGRNEMLVIGDLNHDIVTDVPYRSTVYELDSVPGGGFAPSWGYQLDLGRTTDIMAMVAGDDDGDARHEIFLSTGLTIVRLDGVERRETHRAELESERPNQFTLCRDLELGDLNGDGGAELVCLMYGGSTPFQGNIAVLDAATLTLIKMYPNAIYGEALALGNVDTDPALEIVTNGGWVFDGASVFAAGFDPEWQYADGFASDRIEEGDTLEIGDLNGDGIGEIVATTQAGPIRVFDAVAQTLRYAVGNELAASQGVHIADVTGDARQEIVVGNRQPDASGLARAISVYEENATGDGANLVLEARSPIEQDSITVADVIDDGGVEIIWGGSSDSPTPGSRGLVVASVGAAGLTVRWRLEDDGPLQLFPALTGGALATGSSGSASPLYAGFTAQVEPPALPGIEDPDRFVRLARLDTSDGSLAYSETIGPVGTLRMTVGDYDNDGVDEAFLGALDEDGGYFLAYDVWAEQTEWRSASLGPGSGTPVALSLGDVNADGNADLVAQTLNRLIIFDVVNDTVLFDDPGAQLLDRDADGVVELVPSAGESLVLYTEDQAGNRDFGALRAVAAVRGLVVVDPEGDGSMGIYAATTDPSDSSRSVFRWYDTALVLKNEAALSGSPRGLVVERPGAARTNLAVVYGVDRQIAVIDPRTGTEIWRTAAVLAPIEGRDVQFVDIGGDGQWELSIAIESRGGLLSR